MVDLVGIEPTTSSMPWNAMNAKLLTVKAKKIGRTGKMSNNWRLLTPSWHQIRWV